MKIQKILSPTPENIQNAAEALISGKLVVIPTETVYGLAANALDPTASASIFETKRRPFFDPLICHISSLKMLDLLTITVSPTLQKLIDTIWPGPLTIVVEKKGSVPDIVTSGLSTVAIRMPSHPVTLKLIESAKVPLAAPSANIFGKLSPTLPEHALQLADSVYAILDGGKCSVGLESTIVREKDGKLFILRPGGTSAEEIEEISGKKPLYPQENELPDAPGQLPSHYAPRSKVVIINEGEYPKNQKNSSLLSFRINPGNLEFTSIEVLSEKGDLKEAASRFFEALHKLDKETKDTIYVERVPENGLGQAIMNRLQKAAHTFK